MRGALVLSVFLLGSCGAAATTPKAALQQYAQALRSGDVDAAYALMSAEFRARHSRDDFGKMLRANKVEATQTAERLALESGRVIITAEFDYGLDEHMQLVKEGKSWRVASNPLAFYSQKTPQETVRSFVRAYTLKRWEVMLRFVPSHIRDRMTVAMIQKQFEGPRKEAMQAMMDELRVNLNAPISDMQRGNEARLRYGEKSEVELVREQGLWKIKRL